MTNSQNAATTTCFSAVLRRLLCSSGLPTHPSSDADNPKEQNPESLIKLQPPSPTTTTTTTIPAGIVAKLMGLDSFPNTPNATRVSLGSIMRKSRSVGSVDFLPNFDITKQPHHRRVTTSLSFREVPTTFLHDIGKPELGLTPIQEKSANLNKKKKKIIKKSQNQSQRVNCAKKKVVDDGFPEEKEKKKKCSSRKRNYNHPLPKMGKHDHRKEKKKSILKKRESEYSEEYCIKVLVEVFSLTMVEMERSVWVDSKEVNNLQEISYEIGKEILQLLLYEMVDELCKS